MLHKVEWWRVVCDEVQHIYSISTNVSNRAYELESVNRWGVTGTLLLVLAQYVNPLHKGKNDENFKVPAFTQ